MKLSNLLILLLAALMILACEKDELIEPEPVTYSFIKLEFLKTSETTTEEHKVGGTSPFTISNATPTAQTYTYNYFENQYEYSQFFGIDSMIISAIIDLPFVSVPHSIGEFGIFPGEKRWMITNHKEKLPPSTFAESTSTIQPYTQLTFSAIIIYQSIKTDYKLTLLNNNTNQEETFDGVWQGSRPARTETTSVYKNL